MAPVDGAWAGWRRRVQRPAHRPFSALALVLAPVLALLLALVLASTITAPALAADAAPLAADPALESRVMRVAAELRCLVCQNQTIADSHADLAVDLRNQVRDMLRRGDSEAQVYAYMTARYGDFVLYRPPLKSTTALLWFAPALLGVGGLLALVLVLRRRSRLSADRFEADPADPADDAVPPPAPQAQKDSA